MENTIGLRIERIQQWSGLGALEFTEKIGVIRTQLYRYKNGENQPNYLVLEKILIEFPDISPQWLMLGVGEMLISQKGTATDTVAEKITAYGSPASDDELLSMLKGIKESISTYIYRAEKRKL